MEESVTLLQCPECPVCLHTGGDASILPQLASPTRFPNATLI